MQPTFIGIEIGGTKLQLVAGDGSGKVLERHRFHVNSAGGAAAIRQQIERTLPALVSTWRPAALGIGFGGPVDRQAGTVVRSHQIEGWSGFALRDWAHRLAGVPVVVENDANTAALGEACHGAGVGSNPVFYVTLGSGVGGGLVVDRQIYHGAKPGEAEIGHLRLDREGTIVEQRCSGWAVDRAVRESIAAAPEGLLARLARGAQGGEARLLAGALQQNDPTARRILEAAATDLAFALSHVVHLFHPETIVLGGGLSLVGDALRQAVARALSRWVMEVFQPGPRVVLTALGEDAVPVGALALARGLA
jgi:glucokinase